MDYLKYIMNQNESDIINKNQPITQYKKTFLINYAKPKTNKIP